MKYLLFTIFSVSILFTLGAQKSSTNRPTFDRGKILYKVLSCNQCHAVSAIGMEALTKSKDVKGSDLSGFKTKEAVNKALFTGWHDDMSKWDEASKKLVKPFKGTDEELQAILDWLGSLEAQE